ncbi:hypothetical protein BJ166DRAFT_382270 [Pestalotiopsis sp. NC0098]|nr:hypothetical protein BJ166DRAFT_382270 [Pestalotiopsis sp. NC0098]
MLHTTGEGHDDVCTYMRTQSICKPVLLSEVLTRRRSERRSAGYFWGVRARGREGLLSCVTTRAERKPAIRHPSWEEPMRSFCFPLLRALALLSAYYLSLTINVACLVALSTLKHQKDMQQLERSCSPKVRLQPSSLNRRHTADVPSVYTHLVNTHTKYTHVLYSDAHPMRRRNKQTDQLLIKATLGIVPGADLGDMTSLDRRARGQHDIHNWYGILHFVT